MRLLSLPWVSQRWEFNPREPRLFCRPLTPQLGIQGSSACSGIGIQARSFRPEAIMLFWSQYRPMRAKLRSRFQWGSTRRRSLARLTAQLCRALTRAAIAITSSSSRSIRARSRRPLRSSWKILDFWLRKSCS